MRGASRFAYGTVTLCGAGFHRASATLGSCARRRSYNPGRGQMTAPVWANARSLATTCAIIVIFSSSGYLDVSVPRVRPPHQCGVMESLPSGFPIRTSAGRGVFAPHRGFSQLVTSFVASESHRHPPCALSYFPCLFKPGTRGSAAARCLTNFRQIAFARSLFQLDFSLRFFTLRVPNMSMTSFLFSLGSPRQT